MTSWSCVKKYLSFKSQGLVKYKVKGKAHLNLTDWPLVSINCVKLNLLIVCVYYVCTILKDSKYCILPGQTPQTHTTRNGNLNEKPKLSTVTFLPNGCQTLCSYNPDFSVWRARHKNIYVIITECIVYLKTNKIPIFQNFCSMWNGHRPGISRLSLKLNV